MGWCSVQGEVRLLAKEDSVSLTNLYKTPWPWFGGKADAAPAVWDALGDVDHYVEPFAGSLAVLLRRPHVANRSYHSETVNDMDGLLCNAWRAIARDPDAVAEAASWPVCEADLHARHLALLAWRAAGNAERLMADPDFFDAKMAGWWAWGQSCWIGSGWCSGAGPWIVGDDGRITKRSKSGGVHRKLPHLGDDGRGVNRPQLREEGVARQLPHLGDDGRGVNRPQLREEGVGAESEFHPMTMPELTRWLRFLSARLRHVRVLNGDWTRACTGGALQTLTVRQGGTCGVFLDPPYDGEVRTEGLYTVDSGTVASDVRRWCKVNGDNPRYRIVLAGFDSEHEELEASGWTAAEWFRAGFLKGGMAQQSASGTQQHRERLWLSPHCLRVAIEMPRQRSLFALGGV
jgi:site-specific DNA-adenine methylase